MFVCSVIQIMLYRWFKVSKSTVNVQECKINVRVLCMAVVLLLLFVVMTFRLKMTKTLTSCDAATHDVDTLTHLMNYTLTDHDI